jgi:phosphoribosylaminoimidazole-succinocarboxamide synthase
VTTDGLPHIYSGKVRDIYDAGDGRLLMVTSDRLSAFDVVMAEPIPDKGRVLTAMSSFWFEQFDGVVGSHLLSTSLADLPDGAQRPEWEGRVMLCKKAEMLPIECIVRGYITGSAWKEYSRNGTMHGEALPGGLLESAKLPEPVFTPSTKAEEGHDENISIDQAAELVGRDVADRVADLAIALYRRGAQVAEPAGVMLADTKFEFGTDRATGELLLIDEVMTPDSSRFWDAADYEPGRSQASFDKQYVRDWLETQAWDKTPPGPELPAEVVAGTRGRYVEAFERITGASFQRYLDDDAIGSGA